ncbi:MAG: metalloregulator ArsR/SmtB family transcription factor [Dethiobacteria bacterium]|nr:metalloregulator ArsR/SmtB family transcription factor [Dethiobacteria bacterium]
MKNLVNFFKAMGEDTRVRILTMLLEGEMCGCELIEELNLSQSAVSHHMKILKQADLVNDRRDGKWTFYSINKDGFAGHLDSLQEKFIIPIAAYTYEVKQEPKVECTKY